MDPGQIRKLESAIRDRLLATGALRPGVSDLSARNSSDPGAQGAIAASGRMTDPSGALRQEAAALATPPSTAVRLSVAALLSSRALQITELRLDDEKTREVDAAALRDARPSAVPSERSPASVTSARTDEPITAQAQSGAAAAAAIARSALELMPLDTRRTGGEPLLVDAPRSTSARLPAEDVLQAMPRRPGALPPRYFSAAVTLAAVAAAFLLLAF